MRVRDMIVVAWGLIAASSLAWCQTLETLRLRDGGFLRGTIVEWVPGNHATIVLPSGQNRVVPWNQLAPGQRPQDGPAPAAPTPAPREVQALPTPIAEMPMQPQAPRASSPHAQAVRPFSSPEGRYGTFDVSVTPEDTEIRVRPSDEPDADPVRVCEGHCIVELPENRLWVFSASRGWGNYWGYGSHAVRTGAAMGTVRRVTIELRHNLWANAFTVAGDAAFLTGLLGGLTNGCIFSFNSECAPWTATYLSGLALAIVGSIHPSNRGEAQSAGALTLGVGPQHVSVGGVF